MFLYASVMSSSDQSGLRGSLVRLKLKCRGSCTSSTWPYLSVSHYELTPRHKGIAYWLAGKVGSWALFGRVFTLPGNYLVFAVIWCFHCSILPECLSASTANEVKTGMFKSCSYASLDYIVAASGCDGSEFSHQDALFYVLSTRAVSDSYKPSPMWTLDPNDDPSKNHGNFQVLGTTGAWHPPHAYIIRT